jgi:hypothetical protein
MALTITENMRTTAGGKAWRMITVVHDSGTTLSLTAASIDLTYIEAIVGMVTKMSMVAVGSNLLDVMRCSINATRTSLVWASSAVCTQDITIVGW